MSKKKRASHIIIKRSNTRWWKWWVFGLTFDWHTTSKSKSTVTISSFWLAKSDGRKTNRKIWCPWPPTRPLKATRLCKATAEESSIVNWNGPEKINSMYFCRKSCLWIHWRLSNHPFLTSGISMPQFPFANLQRASSVQVFSHKFGDYEGQKEGTSHKMLQLTF